MAYSQTWSNSTPADPCTVTISPAANDLLIGYCVNDSGTANDFTPPAGWTELCELQNSTDNQSFVVWYKKADGSETSVAFDANSGNTGIAAVLAFSGIDTTTPLDVASVTFNNNTSATTSDISITPVSNGCDLVFVLGNDRTSSGDTTFTFTTTAGTTGAWTTRADINSGFMNGGAGSATQTTAGALTAQCTTDTAGGRSGILIALRPATPSPTINTQPQNATVYQGQTANFTVSATTSGGTLHYQWKDDGSNVGTDSNSYTTAATVVGDNGAQITCAVTDDNGTVTSNAATLTVIPTGVTAWLRG